MSLTFPSRVGDQTLSSTEASVNLHKLERVSEFGRKEQVATSVAIDCLDRIRELQPGYLDGVKKWLKSGCVYMLGGAAAIGIAGATIGGVGVAIASEQVPPTVKCALVGVVTLSVWQAKRVSLLYAMLVRDAACRAAKLVSKRDEKYEEARAKEAYQCHQEICRQLQLVYDDCAKKLREETRVEDVAKAIEFKQSVDVLEQKLLIVEKQFEQFHLAPNEISSILQRLKDAIHFAQITACDLSLEKGTEERNLRMLAAYPQNGIQDIAVPRSLRERVLAARSSGFGYIESLSGYCGSLLSGAQRFCAAAMVLAIPCGGYALAQRYYEDVQLPDITWRQMAQGAAIPAGCAAIYKTGAAFIAHRQKLQANAEYVQEELDYCKQELQAIYNKIAGLITQLPDGSAAKQELRIALTGKLPLIQKEIEKLRLKDSGEILARLNQALL